MFKLYIANFVRKNAAIVLVVMNGFSIVAGLSIPIFATSICVFRSIVSIDTKMQVRSRIAGQILYC